MATGGGDELGLGEKCSGGLGVKGTGRGAGERQVDHTHCAVVAEEAQSWGWLQWKGQDLLEVHRGLHDGGLPEQREGPCPAQAA